MRDKDFFIYGLGRMPRHNRTRSEKIQYLEEAGVDTSILDSIDEDEDLLSASKQARFLNSLVSEEKHKRGISNDLIAVLTCVGRNKSNNPLGADTARTTQQRGAFNLARVSSYHSRLPDLNHHKAAASKYCTAYLALYQWQDKHRIETTKVKKEQILDIACGKVKLFQRKHYGRRLLPFDTKGIVPPV